MRSSPITTALLIAGATTVRAQATTAPAAPRAPAVAQAAKPAWPGGIRPGTVLESVVDSIALRTTFPPIGQAWFAAAVRGKRLLLDIGRVDIDVRKDSARAQAYRLMVPKHTTVAIGTRLRVRGPFGTIESEVTGFDVWASRVVATLKLSPAIDSLARKNDKLTASAQRNATAADSAPATACVRDSLPQALRDKARIKWVRDSLEQVVRGVPRPGYLGVSKKVGVRFTQAAGCFVVGRLALAVSLRDDKNEWFVERLVLLDDTGKVIAVKVSDLRFKGHEILGAYDADGDGVDDLATRGVTERAGAVTLLRFDAKAKKFERLTAGFAWEDM
jgi:hypothetical protein